MEQFGSYLGDETRCATVEQVCTVFADGDWIESKDQADDGIRLIQTGNVGNGVYLDKGERARYIDEETFVRLNCTEVLPNDILISRLPDPVGRACIIPDGLGKSITAVDCSIVRLKSHVLPEFFVAYTMTTLYAAQIGSSVTGSTRKRISRKNLGQVVIPTPDIDQQEQFAAFVRQSDKSKLFHKSANAGFENTHTILVELLKSKESFDDGILDRIISVFLAQCEKDNLYPWNYYYVKYPVFRPGSYGKMSNDDVVNKPYMFSVMQTKTQWSQNTYMPYLKEADDDHLSRDEMGQYLVYDDVYMVCENNSYGVYRNDDDSLTDTVTISQNEAGIDTEDRIIKLKKYIANMK